MFGAEEGSRQHHGNQMVPFLQRKLIDGRHKLKPAAVDSLDSGALMLEAAANGLGVAIMHGSHFSDARDPRLTRLFSAEVESPYSYYFVCRPRALKQRAVKIFHDWLLKSGV